MNTGPGSEYSQLVERMEASLEELNEPLEELIEEDLAHAKEQD